MTLHLRFISSCSRNQSSSSYIIKSRPYLLNLSQIIQQLAPPLLPLAMENTTTEVPICVLVRVAKGQESSLVSLRSYLGDLPPALRQQWGSHLIHAFQSTAAQDKPSHNHDRSPAIRAWNVILSLDGFIKLFSLSHVMSALPGTAAATADNKNGAIIVLRRQP
jgi:hypothetical protein